MAPPEIFAIFAIKYARHDRTAELNFMDPSDFHDGNMPIDYLFGSRVLQAERL